MRTWLTIAGLLVVILVGAWAWWEHDPPSASLAGVSAAASLRPSRVQGDAAPGPMAPNVEAERAAVAEPSSMAGLDRERDLHGTVVEPGGRPIAGARVVAELSEVEEYRLLDRGPRAGRHVVGETGTNPDGSYRLRLEPGRHHHVRVSAPGFAPQVRNGCQAGAREDFQLDSGAVLTGTVRATDGRAAVPGTRIAVRMKQLGGAVRVGETVTDAAGVFRIEGLPAGSCLVDVQPVTLAAPRDFDVELRAGTMTVHDVFLTAGISIHGRVLDALTRAGIARAEVGEGLIGRTVQTDAEGAFELCFFEPSSNLSLRVHAAGYADAEPMLRGRGSTASDTRTEIEVLLAKGRQVRGVVVDAAGRPLSKVYVAAAAADHRAEGDWFRSDWRSTETGDDGAFTIGDLRPDMQHALLLLRPGFATAVYEFPADEGTCLVIDFGELRLQPPASLRGEVKDERGEPVAGHEVELHGHNADRWRGRTPEEANGYRAVDGYVATRRCRTDDQGRFCFVDLAAGDYVVNALKFDSHEQVECKRAVASAEQASGVVLQLVRGQALAGTVFVTDGGTLPKCYCSIDPEEGQATSGDVEVRADGTFRASGLARGNYAITVYPYASEADRAVARSFASRVHAHIAAGAAGLRLEVPVLGPVRGTVVDALRAPVAAAWVGAVAGDAVLGTVATDAAGAFVLAVPVGETVRVMACAPGTANEFDRSRAVASLAATAGGAAIELVLPPH